MEKLVDYILEVDFNELDTYNFPQNELFGLNVKYKNILYCFIIKFRPKSDNLICFGPGAHQRDEVKTSGESIDPPYFDRWSWHKYFNDSFIAYSDPMFLYDDEIVLGWFIGDKYQWYLETISLIIKKLVKNQQINYEKILFFGSSGGGFASVCLGTLIKGSKVMVNNAQFFVLNFVSPDHVLKTLFRILENDFQLRKEEIIQLIPYRFDAIELFKKEKFVPEIIYYVNAESKADINTQTLPFINKISKLNFGKNKLTIQFYHEKKKRPHNPLPNNLTIKYIKNYLKSNNVIQIKNICIKIPNGFREVLSNADTKISNNNLSIYFKVYNNNKIKDCIEDYKIKKYNDNQSVTLSKFETNDLSIYKTTINEHTNVVHFWFSHLQDVYDIYSWNADKNINSIFLNLLESVKFID